MTKTLGEALLLAQKNAPKLEKDATNPHFGNRFVSNDNLFAHIRPVLNDAGLVVSQWVSYNPELGRHTLVTRITHAATGESVGEEMLLNVGRDDMQGLGSAITYARRYALTAALGLSTETDDDGNSASGSPGSGAAPAAPRQPSGGVSPQSPSQAPNPNDDVLVATFTVKAIFGPNEHGFYDVLVEENDFKFSTKDESKISGVAKTDRAVVRWKERKNGRFINRYLDSISVLTGAESDDDIPF